MRAVVFNPVEAAQAEQRIRLYQAGRADGFAGVRPRTNLEGESLAEYMLGYTDAVREGFWLYPIYFYWQALNWLERRRHWWHWA